ncbi:hypothetical protein KC207_05055 [Phycicoccus sp. BSK3Z-2]|uniref:DUF2029 domain-containing protein n=1 Tax=Phycicoccus avicenniae TaxID=2828860 RepID=A0A941HZ85_9MICO|nr:hypothetical protein [Phycicoccus avicenniae]MBR7742655.1 hypothetical protein [Phycicoccus avicenniae]
MPPRLPAGASTPAGGRRGASAPPRARGPAALAPVVLLLSLPLVVAALRQAACASGGWEGREPVWRQCASPLFASLVGDGAGRGLTALLAGRVPLEVPPVPAVVTTTLASLAPGPGLPQQRGVLLLWLAVAALLLAGLVVLVGTVHGHPEADPVALALSPVLALTVLLSADLVPVTLAVAAVWAWSRRRPELAGVLVALAVLGGRPALVVLLALVLTPPPRVRTPVRRLLTAGGATGLLVLGPIVALDLGLVTRPLVAWWTVGAASGSPWFVPTLAGHPVRPWHAALLSVGGLVLAAVMLLVLSRRRPRPATADLALLGLVVAVGTGSSAPVSAALWLVPFVALAGIGWRDHLLWAGVEAVHAVAWFGLLTGEDDPGRGLPAGWYTLALVGRLLVLGRLAWVVWSRASWGPGALPGTLDRLPTVPVDKARADVGGNAYPPVTEGP